MKKNFKIKNIVLILILCFTLSTQTENFLFGFQIIKADDSEKNNILVTSAIIDTLISTVTGSTTPPQDSTGGLVMNGDFEIESSGVNTITGDGIDEETHWRFTFNLPQNDFTLQIISAFLTMHLTPMDPSANNDGVWLRGCNCGQIDVGAHTLFQEYTFDTEMLDMFPAQFFMDSLLTNGGISLGYQDDAIVSFAELRLIIESQAIITVMEPQAGELWIAGEKDTIRWNGGASGQFFNIDFSIDSGNTYSLITIGVPADSGYYIWNIPQNILSTKVKIKISDFADSTTFVVSDIFKIKGYVLTKYLPNGDYIPYSMLTDAWGFANYPNDVWPATWWQQFNYQGTDPFTGSQYSQWQGNFVFSTSVSSEHPDWPAFVNTFGTSACYRSTTLGIYSETALGWWESVKNFWAGSCFGIAISNFLAYENKISFQSRYPGFPNFVNASNVSSDVNTIPVINELFTHQFGNPHSDYRSNIALNKTPNQTLNDLKQMFITDGAPLQTLSFLNNPPGSGGHAILAYKVEKDLVTPNIFYAYVYDNSYPDSLNARIVFNTTANGGNGSWSFNHWPTWGGNKWIYLRDAVSNYLTNPTLNKGTFQQSPFTMGDNLLRVNTGIDASVRIKDTKGNTTGYINGNVLLDIPNSTPLIVDNGSEAPPYGYELPAENYSITLNNFTQETTKTFFFTGNKIFSYQRSGAVQTQTDNLFFDGGISVANNDIQIKTVSLLNIINETSQEKLFVVRSVELVQNDSVKIENPDSNKFKLISYGSSKDYDLELNYVTENGIGRFGDFNISLAANTSHTLVPDWTSLTNTQLMVLVDIGNDGTIDDTLSLINQVTGIGDDQGSLLSPKSYNLAQNYPNPFNPVTTIKYSIPKSSFVTIKVYDILGKEVANLVTEEKQQGYYEVEFNASSLSSGIYFYKLQAGSFVETKKMILIK